MWKSDFVNNIVASPLTSVDTIVPFVVGDVSDFGVEAAGWGRLVGFFLRRLFIFFPSFTFVSEARDLGLGESGFPVFGFFTPGVAGRRAGDFGTFPEGRGGFGRTFFLPIPEVFLR